MLLHAIGLIGVEKGEPRLAGDRVPQQRPQLVVADEIDELQRVGKGVAVIGREKNERLAGRPRGERALEGPIEEGGLGGMVPRLRPRDVRDRVDPRPVRVHVGRRVAPRPLFEEIAGTTGGVPVSCARAGRRARSIIDATNGMSPAVQSARSCARPRPSARTGTTCRTPSRNDGSSARSGGGSVSSRTPRTSRTVAATLMSPPPS